MAVRRLSRCILLISAASVRTIFRCAISCCEIDIKTYYELYLRKLSMVSLLGVFVIIFKFLLLLLYEFFLDLCAISCCRGTDIKKFIRLA